MGMTKQLNYDYGGYLAYVLEGNCEIATSDGKVCTAQKSN